MFNPPLGYFITFRTYASWLHGDDRGSVDRKHNRFGTPMLSPHRGREHFDQHERVAAPLELDDVQRGIVDGAIRAVVAHRGWTLHALNVRTNHTHVVVTAGQSPEHVMNTFKSWATRRLRESGLVDEAQPVWSRHGSTIYLFRPEKMAEKTRYVNDCQ
jgi:REP element-mobilizing transposase RayT